MLLPANGSGAVQPEKPVLVLTDWTASRSEQVPLSIPNESRVVVIGIAVAPAAGANPTTAISVIARPSASLLSISFSLCLVSHRRNLRICAYQPLIAPGGGLDNRAAV